MSLSGVLPKGHETEIVAQQRNNIHGKRLKGCFLTLTGEIPPLPVKSICVMGDGVLIQCTMTCSIMSINAGINAANLLPFIIPRKLSGETDNEMA